LRDWLSFRFASVITEVTFPRNIHFHINDFLEKEVQVSEM